MATPTPEAAAAMSTEGDTGDDAEREQRKADQERLVKREKERRERKRLDRSRRMLREGLKADLRFEEDDALFRVERRGWPKNYPAARRLLRVRRVAPMSGALSFPCLIAPAALPPSPSKGAPRRLAIGAPLRYSCLSGKEGDVDGIAALHFGGLYAPHDHNDGQSSNLR